MERLISYHLKAVEIAFLKIGLDIIDYRYTLCYRRSEMAELQLVSILLLSVIGRYSLLRLEGRKKTIYIPLLALVMTFKSNVRKAHFALSYRK